MSLVLIVKVSDMLGLSGVVLNSASAIRYTFGLTVYVGKRSRKDFDDLLDLDIVTTRRWHNSCLSLMLLKHHLGSYIAA